MADTKFSYAWGLIRSKYAEDMRKGISLLEELRFSDSSRDRECRYYITIGYFKLGKYGIAKNCLQPLIKCEPNNDQLLALQSEIDSAINRGNNWLLIIDGMLGMAIVGGVAALAAGLFISYTRRKN